MKKKRHRYFNGKGEGFSLIELLVVIAIMSILIGFVALAIIPYMETAKEGKDQQTIDTVYGAFSSVIALEQVVIDRQRTFKISGSSITDEFSTDYPNFKDSMIKAIGATNDDELIASTYKKLSSDKALSPVRPDADAEEGTITCILKSDGEIKVVIGEISSSNRAEATAAPQN